VLGGSVMKAAGGPEIDWMKIEVDGPDRWAPGHGFPGTTTRCSRRRAARSPGVRPATRRTSVGRHVGVQFHPRPPRGAASWAVGDAATVTRLGLDPEHLIGADAGGCRDTRARVAELVDWVLNRTGLEL